MSRVTSLPRRAGRWGLPAAVLVGLLALAAGPAGAAQHHVAIEDYAYKAANLSVEQGDTVTWTNHDSVAHDVVVTSGPESFRSPLLSTGESWSHTFSTAGSYSYICSLHPDMRASVTATAAPPPPTTAAPAPVPTQQPAPVVPATPAPSADQAGEPGARRTQSPKGRRSTAEPAAAPVAPPAPASPETDTTSLSPLLLVAGGSIAVVVFCLLLMASRPVDRDEPPQSA